MIKALPQLQRDQESTIICLLVFTSLLIKAVHYLSGRSISRIVLWLLSGSAMFVYSVKFISPRETQM